jgi:hypothetical protein
MDWKVCVRKWSVSNLIYYPSICLEVLRNAMKKLSEHPVSGERIDLSNV